MTTKKLLAGLMLALIPFFTLAVNGLYADHGHQGDRDRDRDEVRLRAELAGAAIDGIVPKGRAEFRGRNDRREFKVEVERVNLPGAVLTVLVDEVFCGQITINDDLRGELELNTRDGDDVPNMTRGQAVVIVDDAGTTILAGTF